MRNRKNVLAVLLSGICLVTLSGCVDQHPEEHAGDVWNEDTEAVWEETDAEKVADEPVKTADASELREQLFGDVDETEREAVALAKKKVKVQKTPRIVATSPAVAQICDKLDLDLVGVCSTTVSVIPKRYEGLTEVGTAMAPDMEIMASLDPDWILSPSSLQTDLQPKYEVLDTDWTFLNLKSVTGMYQSIQELGEIFDREDEADAMINDFLEFYEDYQNENNGKDHPDVLILMGLPGSYIIATENSYVGNLVEMAGGKNVYAGSDEEFLTVNTEDMKKKEPDIILRAAHALPDQVLEMFREDFETNDIWKHFKAVQEGRVYDLSYEYFGMSANFDYPEALAELQEDLYGE